MTSRRTLTAGLFLFGALLVPVARVQADSLSKKHQDMVDRGLASLAKQQFRDGHWEANRGQFASAMTGIAGTTLLMDGSTTRSGKYAENIRKSIDWLIARTQKNGMIGEP